MPFPSVSVANGAIQGWDSRNPTYFSLLQSIAHHYGQDVNAAFEAWPADVQKVVLWGSGEEKFRLPTTVMARPPWSSMCLKASSPT